MTSAAIADVRLRGILTSRGEPTIEAQLTLRNGVTATASCPIAIAPGRRERMAGTAMSLGPLDGPARQLAGPRILSQAEWDRRLADFARHHGLGTMTTLPLSMAYCKACAQAAGVPLHVHLARLARTRPAMPALLVNVFSGGIHRQGPADGFQQIMMIASQGASGVADALSVFGRIEARHRAGLGFGGYSASSGLLVTGSDTERLLGELRAELDSVGSGLGIGFDVAAEHLRRPDGCYRFEGKVLDGQDLAERIEGFVARYGVRFVEDPFDPADELRWRELTARLSGRADVVGDDLFATDQRRVRPGLASGIVLKMNQVGTVSGTIAATTRARKLGLACCVSHRSGETEDTSMCDLAVGLGVSYIKVGGPRRGDRTAKYNQLLRLEETLAATASRP
jgi:enolase